MSLGFVASTSTSAVPTKRTVTGAVHAYRSTIEAPAIQRTQPRSRQEVVDMETEDLDVYVPPNIDACPSKVRRFAVISLLVFQSCLDFASFAFVGLTIKWCLTLDDECAPHNHPHEYHENYIQRPNNLLSIIMAAFIIDFVEPFLLLSLYCRNQARRKRRVRMDLCYGFCKRFVLFFSWLCFTLISMSLAACWALAQEVNPPDLRPARLPPGCSVNCTSTDLYLHIPPPAPPPVSPLLPPGEVYLTYSLCGLAALVKLISYWNGIPPVIIKWTYMSLYD